MNTLIRQAALAATLAGAAGLPLAAAFAQAAAPAAAPAAAAAPNGIIIVDMDDVIARSAAGRSAQTQLKARADALQGRANTLRDQFAKEEESLIKARQGNTMAEDAWNTKVRDLQSRRQTAENELRTTQSNYARSQAYVLKQINDATNPIVSAIMRERNASIALAAGATLQHAGALNVTNDVVTRLDRALPSVRIDPPAQTSQKAPAASPQR